LKKRLFTPGPTPVPEAVSLAMAAPIIHHRTPEFEALFAEVNDGLKYLFQTQNEVFTLACSGTGAMEAAVVNILSRGEKVLVIRGGKFGERWAEIASAYGAQVEAVDVEWGHPINLDLVANRLKATPDLKAVFATQSETSTGVLYDVQALGELVRGHQALLVVDAITGIGVHELLTDAWHLDVVVTGSQKGMMLPPGLAFVTLSQAAWQAVETSDMPRYYFDLDKARQSLEKNQTPYTPAVSLVVGLKEALGMIRTEALENIWRRHQRQAQATRDAVRALGLELFAQSPSNVLTAVIAPQAPSAKQIIATLFEQYGVKVAGGQDRLKDRIFRISHIGYVDHADIVGMVSALEGALKHLGWNFEVGAGVAAAQRVLTAEQGN